MFKYLILIAFIVTLTFECRSFPNEVLIDMNQTEENAIKKEHLGIFFEYIYYKVNGKLGMSAQEIQDRGFDTELFGMDWEKHQYWFLYNTCSKDSIQEMKPWYYGFNKKGLRHYAVKKYAQNGNAGFEQAILLDSGKTFDFYVYVMGTVDSVYLELEDRQSNVIFYKNLGSFPKDWEWHKLSCKILPFKQHYNCKIRIYAKSRGELHLDESSLMATDNQYSLRKEFVDMIRELKPGLMRFPGGSFCDYFTWHFYEHIGDKNQRRAPNYWIYDSEIMRMDFGLDEYFHFCKDLDIEPYITTNFKSGSVPEALDLLEYCNGDTNTILGKLRAKNGNIEPMKVKFFEIGNEQWKRFSPDYPVRYLDYYYAMKQKDSSIKILINGFHWDGEKEINRIVSVVKDNEDYFSWHPGYASFPKDKLSEEDEYNTFAYGAIYTQEDINWMMKSLKKYNPNIKNAPTEYWTQFMDMDDWVTDTSQKGSTLLSGLGDINFLHTFIKNWETTGPTCRTIFLTFFFSDTAKDGRRVIYASPGYYALKMFFNSHGNDYVHSQIISSEKNYAKPEARVNFFSGASIFDVVATKSKDSLFVAILNRSKDASKDLFLNIPGFQYGSEVRIQQLYSNSFYDRNSSDEPLKIIPISTISRLDSIISLPKHSYTIISIPLNKINRKINTNDNKEIKIYPIPSTNFLTINSPNDIIEKIEIIDLIGNHVKSFNFVFEKKLNIDISQLSYGIYILKYYINNKPYFCKIIKTP